jgi:RNA polymerase sigma-70 factor (ECF subfamily)
MWIVLAVVAGSARMGRWAEDRRADQAAMERLAQGDPEALGDLYDRHARPVYALALRILQDPADAEDIVQEVFAQAWTQARRYDVTRGAVSAWLLTLARSRAIDRLRARRARPDRAGIDLSPADIVDPVARPDTQLLSSEQVRVVRAALAELPRLQRVALELAYYEGLTHSEIAEQLEQPLGTVKTRIRQALLKLRDAMTETLA